MSEPVFSPTARPPLEGEDVHPSAVVEIDRARRTVTRANERLAVGGRGFDLLVALTAQSGRVCSLEELKRAAWRDLVVQDSNVRVQIAALRQLIGSGLIVNVARQGYQYVGRVREVGGGPMLRLIGRDDELRSLGQLLAQCRLVTVTGAGGIGKTSLVQAWLQREPTQRDPASADRAASTVWVELAHVVDAAALWSLLGRSLGLPAQDPGQSGDRHGEFLQRDPRWAAALAACRQRLVLDNAEHLAGALAGAAQILLDVAPDLQLLVTSQVPLRLPAEHLLRLGPLELPEPRARLVQPRALGALALFEERVRMVEPRFQLGADNVAAVADICYRLDGLPLAIELAAARVPTLGLHALSRSLGERLDLVASGARLVPARQRTLRAALAWSYGLLDKAVQEVFCRLASFVGAFTLAEAQRALAPVDINAAARCALSDAVGHLVDVSLLAVDAGEPARYRLLELPRLFALELLGSAPVRDTADAPNPADAELRRLVQQLLSERAAGRPSETPADSPVPQVMLSEATILQLARRLRADELQAADTAVLELRQAVELAESVVADGADEAIDVFVDEVLTEVAEHTRAGEFDRGTDSVDEALAELLRRDARRRAALCRSQQVLLEAGVQQDLLRRDAFAVARRIETLVALDHPEHTTASPAWHSHETRYLREGTEQARSLRLEVAIAMLRRRAAAARDDDAQATLARALALHGQRLGGTAMLEESVALCRQCLARCDRTGAPLHWAGLQHQLATALCWLGRHSKTYDAYREAVGCARAALQERTRERHPLDWAASQHALGEPLLRLGLGEAGSTLLNEAVSALRAALTERDAATHPDLHAETQIQLGNALSALARRQGTRPLRDEAVAAFRIALPLLSRTANKDAWWRTHNGLGLELTFICEQFEQGTEMTHEALDAFDQALSVMPEESMPLLRAVIHHNMALTTALIGKRQASLPMLHQAELHFQTAMLHNTRVAVPHAWGVSRHELAVLYLAMARLQPGDAGVDRLRAAIEILDDLLQLWTREATPIGYVENKLQLLLAWTALGERLQDAACMRNAVQAGQDGLGLVDEQTVPLRFAQLTEHTARARHWLASCRA